MSYRGSWKIDDYLTFCCNTHDPDTGVATDADSVPTYRVYEDETATPILTGSTALLDAANTAGFYSERIQLTAANGFEKGKCYTIYITATVDSDTGTTHHFFQIEAEVDANTASDLHADLDDGGRLDLLIDAIKAKTDNLPADPADDSDIDGQLATITTHLTDVKGATFAGATDSLEAIRNRGDAAWTTGSGGDATEAKQDAIITDLDDVKGTGFVKDTDSLTDLAHIGADGDTLETLSDQLDDVTTLGTGAITFTYTLLSSVDSAPIASATVWVTTDQAGTNVVASGTTNTSGEVVFYLDAGDYFVWREKSGFNFTNPDQETVS